MEENWKVKIITEKQKNKLIIEIDELKEILKTQISNAGINNKETIEISQKLDELIIKHIKDIIENEN